MDADPNNSSDRVEGMLRRWGADEAARTTPVPAGPGRPVRRKRRPSPLWRWVPVAAAALLMLAAAGLFIASRAEWAAADDVAAIVVGGLMIVAAAHTIREASEELLDRMPPPETVDAIRRLSESFPGVAGVDRILGRKTGMHYLIDLHLEVPGDTTVDEAHLLGHQVKDWLMAELPEIRDIVVHLEPETKGEATDGSEA